MAHTITGSDTYSPSASVPSDGDPAVAASVDAVFQILLNNDVANRTDVSHQAMDDRGKTSTVTGDIVLNDGGGSVDFELPVTLGADVDINGTVIIHTGGEFTSFAPVDIRNDSTIGSTGTDQCDVNARTDHYGETVFHSDVTVTTGDNFTAKGPVLFEGPTTTIQSPLNQIGLDDDSSTSVAGTLTVGVNAVVGEQLIVLGNSTLGNSSTDEHTVTGNVTMNDELHVSEEVTIDDTLTVSAGGVQIHGSSQFHSSLTVSGDTTIGSNSSDDVTFNAQVVSPVTFGTSGRVVLKPTIGPDSNTNVSVTTTNVVWVPPLTLTSNSNIYTLQESDAQTGDEIVVSNGDSHLLTVQSASGNVTTIQATAVGAPGWVRAVMMSGAWVFFERRTA